MGLVLKRGAVASQAAMDTEIKSTMDISTAPPTHPLSTDSRPVRVLIVHVRGAVGRCHMYYRQPAEGAPQKDTRGIVDSPCSVSGVGVAGKTPFNLWGCCLQSVRTHRLHAVCNLKVRYALAVRRRPHRHRPVRPSRSDIVRTSLGRR